MYLVVDVNRGDVWLRDVDVFTDLHVVAVPRDASEADIARTLGDEGQPGGDGHLWIAVHAPRRLMGRRITDEWEESFREMLDAAHHRGWTNGATTQVLTQILR